MTTIRLIGEIITTSQLSPTEIRRCFWLMSQYYENVFFERFLSDLQEKQWIILLKDNEDQIQGFSTQTLLDISTDNKTIKALFSGDTIIHKDYWGELELARVWAKLAFSLLDKEPDADIYWFLICKGYKTYRFLPTYFHSFYPRFDRATPTFEKSLMDSFGLMKFPDHYNPKTGVIELAGVRDYLKVDVAEVTSQRLKNPHIDFFCRQNPGYPIGDELVCVARISKENMKSIVHRYYLKGNV